MKKNKKIVAALSVFTAVGLLAGCEFGKKDAKLDSVSLNGLATAYGLDSTIDWSKVSVKLNYSDGNSVTITDVEYDVETAKLAKTEALISTEGLYDGDTSKEGSYKISVKLKVEDYATKRDVMTVAIEDFSPSKYSLISFTKPAFITNYEKAIEPAEAGASEDVKETKFVSTKDKFTVGTMNTFRFLPVALFKRNGSTTPVASTSFKKDVVIQELNEDGSVKGDASNNEYEVVTRGINFKDAAIGKDYKIIETPQGFTKDSQGHDVKAAEFIVHVEKGVNIHNAKELGIINLNKYTPADFAGEQDQHAWFNHIGVDEQGGVHNNGTADNFYDANTKSYIRIDEDALWKEFMLKEGVISESEFDKVKSAPSFFICNDIDITPSDLPKELFITEEECADADKYAAGSLRDNMSIYKMILDQDVTLNGNYFTIDSSKIPVCKSNDNGGFHVYTKQTAVVEAGHATLFEFDGISPSDSTLFMQTQVANPLVHKGYMKNINTVGNTKQIAKMDEDSQVDRLMNMTGLIFAKTPWCSAEYDNIIAKQYMIGIFADTYLGQKQDLTYNSQHATVLKNSKMYDCANSGIFNYNSGNFQVKNTTMKRFGGACILNIGDKNWYYAANTTFDKDCVMENFITGEEVYFAAMGATSQVSTITALNLAFMAEGLPQFLDNGKMNLITLSMDDSYLASQERAYTSSINFEIDGMSTFETTTNNMTKSNVQLYNMVPNYAEGQYAPVCTTEYGETFLINPNGQTYPNPLSQSNETHYILTANQDQSTQAQAPLIPYTWFDTSTGGPNPAAGTTINGSYLNMLAPVGNTTLSMNFLMPTK